MPKKILTVFGNRPQFIKAGVVSAAIDEFGAGEIEEVTVHTGQHYDAALSDDIFRDLNLKQPDYHLAMGSGPILDQIGKMLPLLRDVAEKEQPDAILAYGDTNSTAAAAIVAGHLDLPFVHIEAGERNFRRRQAPEEINRIVADHLCAIALVSTTKAARYLTLEGFHPNRIRFVGDTMFDLFINSMDRVDEKATLDLGELGLSERKYFLATIHRAENTDDPERLVRLMNALDGLDAPVVLPLHPRTKAALGHIGWSPSGSLRFLDPLGYFDILYLLRSARASITDSGGLSKESFFAGVPVVIPMPNSGWREIVEQGWAKVIPDAFHEFPSVIEGFKNLPAPVYDDFGDGKSGEKIVEALKSFHFDVRRGEWHICGDFDRVSQADNVSAYGYDRLQGVSETTAVLIRDELAIETPRLLSAINASSLVHPVLCVGSRALNILSPRVGEFLRGVEGECLVLCEPEVEAVVRSFARSIGQPGISVQSVVGASKHWTETKPEALVADVPVIEAARLSELGRSELEVLEREGQRVHIRTAQRADQILH